ncbi:MAG TPA: hypothetical protein GXX28_06090 [Firmicutes bacterium]|nr:hypothetical protein [Bacillota bacterium]
MAGPFAPPPESEPAAAPDPDELNRRRIEAWRRYHRTGDVEDLRAAVAAENEYEDVVCGRRESA